MLMSLESGPLMTMIIIGTAGIASFEPQVFVGAVLPFIIGFVLGNLEPALRDFFTSAVQTLIPFFAFALGNTIDLAVIAHTGLLGILLGLMVIIITGIPLILADRFIGVGDGTAGMAPQFAPMAPAATALVETSVIVTSILVPVITALYSRRIKRRPAGCGGRQPDHGRRGGERRSAGSLCGRCPRRRSRNEGRIASARRRGSLLRCR